MESFLPSEIGRLIYGYLSEHNQELADLFLNRSNVMEECRSSKNKSRKFSAKVQGLTLIDILDRYSILCSLIFKQVPSSECVHLNVLNALKKILHSKVCEQNEQLARELIAQDFNFVASVSDTTEPKRNEINDSANENASHQPSPNVNNSVNATAACVVDNSILAIPDVTSMDVSSSSAVNESHNSNKTVEKTVQTEVTNVISLLEEDDNSLNNTKSSDVPEKSKEDPPIDLTEPSPLVTSPSVAKVNEPAPVENLKNTVKAKKSCNRAATKAKSKTDAVKDQVCKSKIKNSISSALATLTNAKVDETKQQEDLHTPPEAEKCSRLPQHVFDNLTLNTNYRRDSYVTPLKRNKGNVFGHTILQVNNDEIDDAGLTSIGDDFQSSPSSPSRVSTNIVEPTQPVVDIAPVQVASHKIQSPKTVPNILKPPTKSDSSKNKPPKSTPPNQGKPPPVTRKPKPDQNEPPAKPVAKPAIPNDKEMHLVVPRAPVVAERKLAVENPHLLRPPPLIDAPWDSRLRTFVGDAPESTDTKTTRKTPRKTPRKQKRVLASESDEHPKKRTKLDESALVKTKRVSKSKASDKEVNTSSSDLDKSIENQIKESTSETFNGAKPQSNKLSVAALESVTLQPSHPVETPIVEPTPKPPPAGNNDSVDHDGADDRSNVLSAAAETTVRSEWTPVDESEEASDDGYNLTLEPEVVLYEANLLCL